MSTRINDHYKVAVNCDACGAWFHKTFEIPADLNMTGILSDALTEAGWTWRPDGAERDEDVTVLTFCSRDCQKDAVR